MLSLLFFCSFFFTLSVLSVLLLVFSLYSKQQLSRAESAVSGSDPAAGDVAPPALEAAGAESEALCGGDPDPGQKGCGQRRKKKRAKKKSKKADLEDEEEDEKKKVEKSGSGPDERPELICLYPFTSSGSATQRRIKQQYDEVVKSHQSKGLTIAQVGQFANCLVDARNELQHKSEVIHRKFSIAKALLLKADRSSFDRVRQQIYKLELEQKRLEEDAFVYNWLQQQLKLSPAYKKMLEISACMELNAKSAKLVESKDADLPDISFEEFLAQEKKNVFWQKLGKSRSGSG